MEIKQTAVEWLVEQMIQHGLVPKGTHSDNILFHKAKAMEKEQIIDSFGVGCHYESKRLVGYHDVAEQYYTETYL